MTGIRLVALFCALDSARLSLRVSAVAGLHVRRVHAVHSSSVDMVFQHVCPLSSIFSFRFRPLPFLLSLSSFTERAIHFKSISESRRGLAQISHSIIFAVSISSR